MYELLEFSEFPLYWGCAYLISIFLLSLFILGLFLAANHTFVEKGKEKGLILVSFKESVESFLVRLDKMRILVAIKNWLFLLSGFGAIIYPSVKILQTSDVHFIALYSFVIAFAFFQKSFEDIGVMFLGCYRCMPTFWVALPLALFGVHAGFSYHSSFFWFVPFAFITTSIISALVTLLYMLYDKTKLSINEMKTSKELIELNAIEEYKESMNLYNTIAVGESYIK